VNARKHAAFFGEKAAEGFLSSGGFDARNLRFAGPDASNQSFLGLFFKKHRIPCPLVGDIRVFPDQGECA
jgi:hypothetical protein